jgi:endoglucanase
MSSRRRLILIIFAAGILVLSGVCLVLSRSGHLSFTPPIAHRPSFSADTAAYPVRLHTSKNAIADVNNQPVVLKGLMPPDPAQLNTKGKFTRSFFQEMRDAGSNVIRIPIHPGNWEQDPDYLWRYLDPIVAWSGEMGMYVILDLHFIGNIASGAGSQMPNLHTSSRDFTLAFWKQVATYFKDTPNVIFEICNEPADITPSTWRSTAQEIVALIRGVEAEQVVIVGGVEYSKNLSWVENGPVDGENIAYAAHIYPVHSASSWDAWFGDVSAHYPVLVTEWGWLETAPGSETAYLVGSASSYGEPFLSYLNEHKIGWVACWYDDDWLPAMFQSGFSGLTDYGKFVKAKLQ